MKKKKRVEFFSLINNSKSKWFRKQKKRKNVVANKIERKIEWPWIRFRYLNVGKQSQNTDADIAMNQRMKIKWINKITDIQTWIIERERGIKEKKESLWFVVVFEHTRILR